MTANPGLCAHLDRAFPDSDRPARLGVAVSGGSDSLGLLFLLQRWGRVPLAVATVDHELREAGAAEAARVAEVCVRLGLAHRTLKWDDWDGQGNLQDQARRARYRLLADWATAEALADVALGHTLDDQAETFLLGLARGAGLDGLSGMRPVFARGAVRFHRPLLGVRRAALRDFLTGIGATWVEDPSNDDTRFDRVRARKALAALAPLGIDAEGLGRTIGNLRSTRAGIEAALADWARHHVTQDRGDLLITPAEFAELPPDFARRILNQALRWVSGADYPPRAEPVMQVVDGPRQGRATLHGCLISFEDAAIRVAREPGAAAKAPPCPTREIWDGRWRAEGPHAPGLEIRALGEDGLTACPDWRTTLMPRASLAASPAIWRGETVVSAPIAGFSRGWTAELAPERDDFAKNSLSR